MIKSYLKIAIRNLLTNKVFSAINISGLTIGIASCILIMLFVQNEISYDRYHKEAEQIYRVHIFGSLGGNDFNMAVSCAPMAAALMNEFPEVKVAARVRSYGFPVARYEDKAFSEEKWYSADSTYFDVFTCQFLEGMAQGALAKPNTVVITESMRKKYFGDESALGKVLRCDNRRDYMITGVIEDIPANSHFHPEFLGSLSTYEDSRNVFWVSNNFYTYFVLEKDVDINLFEEKIQQLITKYAAPQIEQALGQSWEELKKQGAAYEFKIQKLTDIHLHSNLAAEIEPTSDATYVYIFSIIALSILIIACINFMNLSTAKSTNRSKEVGIRKTLGSTKGRLISQFLSESVILTIISVMFAIVLVYLTIPYFNNIAGKNLEFGLFSNLYSIPLIILFAIVVGLFAGIYPAFFLSAFDPVLVLKGNVKLKGGSSWLRSSLVIFQFAVSVVLFIGTFIVSDQLYYIQNKNLGFDKEQILVVQKTDDLGDKVRAFKQELLEYKDVKAVSNSNVLPLKITNNSVFNYEGPKSQESFLLNMIMADYDFAEVYGLKIKTGRYFEKEKSLDSNSVVLNEKAIAQMNYADPIGKHLIQIGRRPEENNNIPIVGVVEDFHYQPLHSKIQPLAIFPINFNGRFVSVKISAGSLPETITFIEQKWKKFAGAQAFEYTFFDEDFSKNYEAEQQTANIFTSFSFLSIMIACLGLLGLAAFITEQRTKEIGIRKVLGANIMGILILLCKEFAKWVVIANVIAWPLAYFVMDKWLQGFAYRTELGIGIFLISGILAMFVALITVVTQVIKVATANPVNSLRYE